MGENLGNYPGLFDRGDDLEVAATVRAPFSRPWSTAKLFPLAENRACRSSRKAALFNRLRAFGFLFHGYGITADPHQPPFWIKALGLLREE